MYKNFIECFNDYKFKNKSKKDIALDFWSEGILTGKAATSELNRQLEEGYKYLMSVGMDDITVENALEAFGFGRNGLGE